MNCIISSDITDIELLRQQLSKVPSMAGLELSSKVTTSEAYTLGDENSAKRIAVLDFGVKRNILTCMVERGAYLKVFPAKTSFATCEEFNPSAYFISNGPGDPSTMTDVIEVVRELLLAEVPLFGICFGHQILGRALGFESYKLQFGHRGINQPVIDKVTEKVEITAHNHGFAIKAPTTGTFTTVFGPGHVTHVNLNDDVVEGLALLEQPAFSVQYHPEAAAGPHDANYLFDRFVDLMAANPVGAVNA
jgi:carbamoyl-phosphate synthase small subunit